MNGMSTLAALPITDPVLIFALAMVIFVGAPLLFERLRIPGIIGLIVAGAIIGPNGLNLLERGATIVLLGTVGLLYLMFMVGLELDLHDFNRYRNRSIIFGSLSFVIPQVAGTGLGLVYGYPLASSLLLGSVFASHTVLAYPIASRLGIVKTLAVTTTLGGTILTEILALLVLAIVAGSAGGSLDLGFWAVLVTSLAVYIGAIMWGVPIVARAYFRHVRSDSTLEFVFVMAVLFTVAWLAHFAKAEPIVGALLAGLALNRLIPHSGALMNRINFVGNALFIPFFLLSVGMLVDVQALATVEAWVFAVGVAAGVLVAKLAAAKLTERVFRFNRDEGWVIFGLSVPHASGTLAIVLVGFDLMLFDQMEVNGIVLTILVTSLVGPWVVEHFGRNVALQEEQKPYEPREAPQRILIPLANPATEEMLLDLAILLRGSDSDEPLHPLIVVPEHAEGSEAQVAEAERVLSHAVIHAAGAEVPVVPLTRVDQNIAAGIVRGIAETRTSTVVIGWDGGRSPVGGIFGSVLDQLLLQAKAMVVVAKLGHPLNVTKRLVVVLPPLIYRHPGFFEAMRGVKSIASQLGAPILGLGIDEEQDRLEPLIQPIRPAAAIQFERVDGWSRLLSALRDRVSPDDLVIVLSARRGTLPWHPKLERLPAQLAGLLPESFLMFYPAEADTPRRETVAPSVLPRGLQPDRIVFDLPKTSFPEALREILRSTITDPDTLERVVAALVAGEREFSTEVRPGVVVPHARVEGIEEPVLFLGTCPQGIEFPQARDAANLIFVLLSPADRPQEHLRSLAEIARLVSREEYVQELLGGAVGAQQDELGSMGGRAGTAPDKLDGD
jgi:Kef-type K+ transport system membrane component KefB/mannitol/fructose-specific phosphotransferase system IIA component (Ntr-type)